jgi:hypothetical protein
MRYDVDTAALHDDVGTMDEVLVRVQRLGIADELRPVAAAFPGSRCAAALRDVAAAWTARLAGTRWELTELGRSLVAAADTYDAVERAARQSVEGSFRGFR